MDAPPGASRIFYFWRLILPFIFVIIRINIRRAIYYRCPDKFQLCYLFSYLYPDVTILIESQHWMSYIVRHSGTLFGECTVKSKSTKRLTFKTVFFSGFLRFFRTDNKWSPFKTDFKFGFRSRRLNCVFFFISIYSGTTYPRLASPFFLLVSGGEVGWGELVLSQKFWI